MVPLLEKYGVDLVLSGHSHSYERSMLIHGHHSEMNDEEKSLSNTFKPKHIVDAGNGSDLGSVNEVGAFISNGGDGAYHKDLGRRGKGAIYSVAGASGKISKWDNGSKDLVNPEPHPVFLVNLLVEGSMVIDIEGQTLRAQYRDFTNKVRDDFSIVKTLSK